LTVYKYKGSETPTEHTESFSVTEPYWKMKITASKIGADANNFTTNEYDVEWKSTDDDQMRGEIYPLESGEEYTYNYNEVYETEPWEKDIISTDFGFGQHWTHKFFTPNSEYTIYVNGQPYVENTEIDIDRDYTIELNASSGNPYVHYMFNLKDFAEDRDIQYDYGEPESLGDLVYSNVYIAPDASNAFAYVFGLRSFDNIPETWNVSKVTNMSGMFGDMEAVAELNVSNWDTSNVENMSNMFGSSWGLEADIGNWDVSKVKDMSWMFYVTEDILPNSDLSNWNTASLENAYGMFNGTTLNPSMISNWDVSKVTNMCSMFSYSTMTNSIDFTRWDVSSVTDMSYMFVNLEADEELDDFSINISNWNASNVTNMYRMFDGIPSVIDSLDLSGMRTDSVSSMISMFGSQSLRVLDLSNFDTSMTIYMSSMFGCPNLEYLIIGKPSPFAFLKFRMTDANCGGLPRTTKILVPRSLLDTFKSATNWSTRASQFYAQEDFIITRSNGRVTVTRRGGD